MNIDLIHLLYPLQYELRFLCTTLVWHGAGSRSWNFTIPALAPTNFGSLRFRLHNTGQKNIAGNLCENIAKILSLQRAQIIWINKKDLILIQITAVLESRNTHNWKSAELKIRAEKELYVDLSVVPSATKDTSTSSPRSSRRQNSPLQHRVVIAPFWVLQQA